MLAEEVRWAAKRVFAAPRRLAFLLRGGPGDVIDLHRFLTCVLPLARSSIAELQDLAHRIPDPQIREQAQSCLTLKAYHVAGACILATFLPKPYRKRYVDIVAPLETIYDFLDSLCDRHPETKPQAYRSLHEALSDAVDPNRPIGDYYINGPLGDDGGYLRTLVQQVRSELLKVPQHGQLVPYFREAASLYADTQTFKHLPPGQREQACIQWHERESARCGDLTWWELGAAAGSQFQVYGPLFAAFQGDDGSTQQTYDAYFPAFSAIHVLLDSFIDQAEDRAHGELNWLDCYPSQEAFLERARTLARRVHSSFDASPANRAHRFAFRIMTLFYLTHPKIEVQGLEPQALALLRALR